MSDTWTSYQGLQIPANPTGDAGIALKDNFVILADRDHIRPSVKIAALSNVASLSGPQTVEGVALSAGDRILLTAQTAATSNGPWIVQASTWTRPDDAATGVPLSGAIYFSDNAASGGEYPAQSAWRCTSAPGSDAVGTDSLAFTQIIGQAALSATTPLAISDNTIALTGVVPINKGGTNSSTALTNNRIMVSSAGAIVAGPALTNGQLLIGSTGAAPVASSLTGTSHQITVTPSAGSITLSLPSEVGIGTTSPDQKLTVSGSGARINVRNADTNYESLQLGADASQVFIAAEKSGTASYVPLVFKAGGQEKLRLETSNIYLTGTTQVSGSIYAVNATPASINVLHGTSTAWTGAAGMSYFLNASAASDGWYFQVFISGFGSPSAQNEFWFRGDGQGYCTGTWQAGGADYAEYFEWADGNPAREDRTGCSVSLDGNKIRPAASGDVVIGVVTSRPTVVGDGAFLHWQGKFLTDDYGRVLYETVDSVEWDEFDNQGRLVKHHSYQADQVPEKMIIPETAIHTPVERRQLNPNFDSEAEYVPREQRPEWACVGLMGKLRLRAGQPTASNWIKLRNVAEGVEEWFVR